jgi:hypothetical protein
MKAAMFLCHSFTGTKRPVLSKINGMPKHVGKIVKATRILVVLVSSTQVHAFSEILSKNFECVTGSGNAKIRAERCGIWCSL